MYSSTLPSASALDGVGGQRHASAALPPGKTSYTIVYHFMDGPEGRSGRMRKISPPSGFDPPDRPARSESLYRLSYSSPFTDGVFVLLRKRKKTVSLYITEGAV